MTYIGIDISAQRWSTLRALLLGTAGTSEDARVRNMCLEVVRQIEGGRRRRRSKPTDSTIIGLRRAARFKQRM